eukprot:2846-Alexandrium_andersonii.AAC.1
MPPAGWAPFHGPPRICPGSHRSVPSHGWPGNRGFPRPGPLSDRCLGPHGQHDDVRSICVPRACYSTC